MATTSGLATLSVSLFQGGGGSGRGGSGGGSSNVRGSVGHAATPTPSHTSTPLLPSHGHASRPSSAHSQPEARALSARSTQARTYTPIPPSSLESGRSSVGGSGGPPHAPSAYSRATPLPSPAGAPPFAGSSSNVPGISNQSAWAVHAQAAAAAHSSTPSSSVVNSRVKVAVRCRPPFREEGESPSIAVMPASYVPQVASPADDLPAAGGPPVPPGLPRALHIEVAPEKRREFAFDVVLGPAATNADVYNVVGGPIVDGVLKGINGTILAYGQTGSGKTHSLGILTRVSSESGIIPRSFSHVFGAIAQAARNTPAGMPATQYTVTMSMLQLYLDTVQDMLAPSPGQMAPGQKVEPTAGPHAADSSMLSHGGAGRAGTPSPAGFGGDAASVASGGGGSRYMGSGGIPNLRESRSGYDAGAGPVNLNVREDPARGFYVEGLSEYAVRSFPEACSLLNWGLENRILGATQMNATSSRSHTVVILRVETRAPVSLPPAATSSVHAGSGAAGFITRRSQLMLCDLAGSERVRRTSSRGARLEEARAINASLHTLGQVIAALSVVSTASSAQAARVHVPWRDSKLTRLLYGNLGGNSNTFLLATVGPGAKNVSESLSTLLFASRCMRVAAAPVASQGSASFNGAEYAELCSRLQGRLSSIEATHAVEIAGMSARYEGALRELSAQLDAALADRNAALQAAAGPMGVGRQRGGLRSRGSSVEDEDLGEATDAEELAALMPTTSSPLLRRLYDNVCEAYTSTLAALLAALYRTGRQSKSWQRAIERAAEEEASAASARADMMARDPLLVAAASRRDAGGLPRSTSASSLSLDALLGAELTSVARQLGEGEVPPGKAHPNMYGPHLGHAYRSAAAALACVHMTHASNVSAGAIAGAGAVPAASSTTAAVPGQLASVVTAPATAELGDASAEARNQEASASQAVATAARAPAATPAALTSLAANSAASLLSPPALPLGAAFSALALSIITGDIHTRGGGDARSPTSPAAASGTRFSTACVLASCAASLLHLVPSASQAGNAFAASVLPPDVLASLACAPDAELHPLVQHPALSQFSSPKALIAYIAAAGAAQAHNVSRLNAMLAVKDARYDDVKRHLAAAEAAVRVRDEDAANQRYVLRYLVDTTTSLREEVRRARTAGAASLNASIAESQAGRTRASMSGGGGRLPGVSDATDAAGARAAVGPGGTTTFMAPTELGSSASSDATSLLSSLDRRAGGSVRSAEGDVSVDQGDVFLDDSFDGDSMTDDTPHQFASLRRRAAVAAHTQSSTARGSDAQAGTPREKSAVTSVAAGLLAGVVPKFSGSLVSTSPTEMRSAPAASHLSSTPVVVTVYDPPTGQSTTTSSSMHSAPARAISAVPIAASVTPTPSPPAADALDAGQLVGAAAPGAVAGKPPRPPRGAVSSGMGAGPQAAQPPGVDAFSSSSSSSTRFPVLSAALPWSGARGVGPVQDDDVEEAAAAAEASLNAGTDGVADEDTIEYIVSHRFQALPDGTGRILYRVHWYHSDPSEDEWFARDDLMADFPDAVAAYEAAQAQRA